MSCLFNNGNKETTISVSSGTGSATFQNVDKRRLVHLIIHPASSTTTFSWKYTDKNSIDISGDEGWYGNRDILSPDDLVQFTYGNFTLTIFDSDADEDFTVLPVFSEEA